MKKFISNQKIRKSLIGSVLIASMLLIIFMGTSPISNVSGQTYEDEVTVLLFTNANSTDFREDDASSAYTALQLDERINLIAYTKLIDADGLIKDNDTYNFDEIDVIVMENFFPLNLSDQIYVLNQLRTKNIGLFFMGGYYPEEVSLKDLEPFIPAYFTSPTTAINRTMGNPFEIITGFENTPNPIFHHQTIANTTESSYADNDIQVSVSDEQSDLDDEDKSPFTRQIAWQSCPLLRSRFTTFAKKIGTQTLVEVPNTKEPLLVRSKIRDIAPTYSTNASVIYLSTGTGYYLKEDGTETLMNEPFSLWPYFNYLMYTSVYYLKEDFDNTKIESYADWYMSPIPHEREAALWMIFVASLWVFNFALYFTLGKKKGERDIRNMKAEIKKDQIKKIKENLKDDKMISFDRLSQIVNLNSEELRTTISEKVGKKKLSDIEIESNVLVLKESETEKGDILMNVLDFIDDNFDEWGQEELAIKQVEKDIKTKKREALEYLFKGTNWVKIADIANLFDYEVPEIKKLIIEAFEKLDDFSNFKIQGSYIINNEERETRVLLALQKFMEIFESGEVVLPKPKEKEKKEIDEEDQTTE